MCSWENATRWRSERRRRPAVARATGAADRTASGGGAARWRLFVALDLPPRVRRILHDWAATELGERSGLRVVPASSLHVTLAFLGDRPQDTGELAAIEAAVVACAGPAPQFATAGAAWLPTRRPRVAAVDLRELNAADESVLVALHGRLTRELARTIEWEADARPLRPHVTVARLGRVHEVPNEAPVPPELTFPAPTVTLYRSHLGEGGAWYEPLASVPLRG